MILLVEIFEKFIFFRSTIKKKINKKLIFHINYKSQLNKANTKAKTISRRIFFLTTQLYFQ